MKLGFLLNFLLLAALILAQEDMEGMEDSEEMEDEEEDNAMMGMGTQEGMSMPINKNDTMMMEMNRRKKNKGLKDIYIAAMLVKSLISTVLSFVPPVMQVKGFGLSVINTIVNVARFILDMRRMMPMISHVMTGWADRNDKPAVHPTMPANRKTVQVPDYVGTHKFYKPHYVPDRHLYPPLVKPLNSVYLPPTTYAPHRSPFRHYYTRYNKDLTTPSAHWSHYDDSNNFLKKSLDISPSQISTSVTITGSTPTSLTSS